MPCNQNCNQGRNCDCNSGKANRTLVIVSTLIIIALVSMGYGVYKLVNTTKGQDCQIEVQFQDSRATYIGKTV